MGVSSHYSRQSYDEACRRILGIVRYAAAETHPEKPALDRHIVAVIRETNDRHTLTKADQARLEGAADMAVRAIVAERTERRCWHPGSRTWRPIAEANAYGLGRIPKEDGPYERNLTVTFWKGSACVYSGVIPEDYGAKLAEWEGR